MKSIDASSWRRVSRIIQAFQIECLPVP
jgi:hypothetical protein